MSLSVAKPLNDVLEKEWEATLYGSKNGLAPLLGWRLIYHTLRSKGSRAGFPDRVLVKDRVIFAESKREKKVATPITAAQIEFLDGLTRAGMECYLWRPSDLDEIARVLSKRWVFLPAPSEGGRLITTEMDHWTPRALWVAGVGRYDEIPVADPPLPGQTAVEIP